MTLEQLIELRAEVQLSVYVNYFNGLMMEADLRSLDAEIQIAKIVNLCLTGE